MAESELVAGSTAETQGHGGQNKSRNPIKDIFDAISDAAQDMPSSFVDDDVSKYAESGIRGR